MSDRMETRIREVGVAVICVFLFMSMFRVAVRAEQADGAELQRVAAAVRTLQPKLDEPQSIDWARDIVAVAKPNQLPPVLVAAFVFRESSFSEAVTKGRRRGRKGELGCMQVMPNGAALRVVKLGPDCSRFRNQAKRKCSLATGAGYLAWLRDKRCGGSVWRWVAAYRLSECPSEREARRDHGARVIRRHHCRADPVGCAEFWQP